MRHLILALTIALGACSNVDAWRDEVARNDEANKVFPANYKTEILALMRTYLNDPANVREASVSEPVIKSFENADRYLVCLRYNAKKGGGQYAGNKETIVTFKQGRLDRIVDATREPREARQARELCKDMAMKPFPELEKLQR
jgi:hypothetical protein